MAKKSMASISDVGAAIGRALADAAFRPVAKAARSKSGARKPPGQARGARKPPGKAKPAKAAPRATRAAKAAPGTAPKPDRKSVM